MKQAERQEEIAPGDCDFRFRSGRLCLDFVATVSDRAHTAFDRWRSGDDFARWCVEAGLLSSQIAVTSGQLRSARRLRELIYSIVQAALKRIEPPGHDIKSLNRFAASPALIPQLKAIGAPFAWKSATPFEAVLSTIARDAIDLLAGPQLQHIRECADEHCSILFVDTSRPGNRRWCAMSGCGNKVKKAAYRERQKSTTSDLVHD